MGLLSHLWHVINKERITGSLQPLETTQIPANYTFIHTPKSHLSLSLMSPAPIHTHTSQSAAKAENPVGTNPPCFSDLKASVLNH